MNQTLLRSASVLLAIVLALGVFTPGRATPQTTAPMPNQIVNLAFFYKPPSNMDAATLAANFDSVILTGGDENFRNSLTARGFRSTIMQYIRSEGIQDPGNCTSTPANNQIANRPGDFCSISQNHPDWFLLDTNGNRMKTSPTSNYYRMDPGNAGWRNFFVTRLLEIQQQKGWSGLFLDNVEASLSEIQRDGATPARYPNHASYQAAVRGFLQYLYQNYSQPYNRPMMGNIIARQDTATWDSYTQYMSGAMQERWAVGWDSPDYISESKWKSDMLLAENTQARGKYIILVAQGSKTDSERQKFAFASYLLVSNGKAAFRYGDEDVYTEAWLYSNYNVDLGSPVGARYQTGSSWRRDFTRGYVIVDPINHTATIATSTTASPTSTHTKTPILVASATKTATTVPATAATSTPSSVPPLTATPTRTPTSVPTQAATQAPARTATPSAVIHDSRNAAFAYSGDWENVTDTRAYQGSFKRTWSAGSYATFSFTGQKFSIIYKTGPLLGKLDVYVDGALVGTVDQKTAADVFQVKWSYGGTLPAGTHQLKLVFSGPASTRATLDAVSIP